MLKYSTQMFTFGIETFFLKVKKNPKTNDALERSLLNVIIS
jgi:hypothetical protein